MRGNVACFLAGCGKNNESESDLSSQTNLTESTSSTEEIKEIPGAELNSAYKNAPRLTLQRAQNRR